MAKTPSSTSDKPKSYRMLAGINYGPEDKRAEEGDVVDDLPIVSIPWLLESGVITADLDSTPPPPTEEMDAPNGGQVSPDTQGEPSPAAPTDPIVTE